MLRTIEQNPGRVERSTAELEWLLDYELCLALRHQRNVSLVLMTDVKGELNLGVLEGLIRRSDELFRLRHDAALLMSETSKGGALKAVERYREACLGQYELRFAVASFPNDGRLTGVLLNVAHRRLGRARASLHGTVVYND